MGAADDLGAALGQDAVLLLSSPREELEWVDLSPEASALVAHVNGVATLQEICVKAGVPAEEGVFLLLDLVDRGIVRFL